MAEQSSWNWGVRQGVRVAGALLMWQIGQRMPKKYNIEGEQTHQGMCIMTAYVRQLALLVQYSMADSHQQKYSSNPADILTALTSLC
jgi:hypothetical protein